MRETRRGHVVHEAGGGIVRDDERGIEGKGARALLREVVDHAVSQFPARLAQRLVARVHGLDHDRDVVLELRPVRHVQVDRGERIPRVDHPQHRLHLGRVGLHVVAVEVEVLRCRAPAHLLGPALVGTVPAAEALVAVHIEHGHEDEHGLVERALGGAALQHFAQRHEARVLAVDLARMDAALDEDHGEPAPAHLIG